MLMRMAVIMRMRFVAVLVMVIGAVVMIVSVMMFLFLTGSVGVAGPGRATLGIKVNMGARLQIGHRDSALLPASTSSAHSSLQFHGLNS